MEETNNISENENLTEESGRDSESCKETKKQKSPMRPVRAFLSGVCTTLAILIAVGLLLVLIPFRNASSPLSVNAIKKLNRIVSLIQNNYLGDIDAQQLTDYMYLGLVAGLEDTYSSYYTAEQLEAVRKQQSGYYTGIGISIASEDEQLTVVAVTEDSPAEAAGILAGDIILSINSTDTSGMTTSEAAALIQGDEDDTVILEIHRTDTDETLTFEVPLDELEATYVVGGLIDDTIGYIRIAKFTKVTSDQFAAAYQQILDEGAASLILDLRGNPGGLTDSVTDVAAQILPAGLLYYTEDKYGNREEKILKEGTPIEMPFAVLVDEDSASASEILAGAIQDYGLGTIIGETTFGKGIVQSTYELSDGSALKITTSHYYTPDGNDIHGVGITPDIEVPLDEDAESDAQLQAAIDLLSEGVSEETDE